MRTKIVLGLCISVFLCACSQDEIAATSADRQPTIETPVFPPTWTPTLTVDKSEPSSTPKPPEIEATITPTITNTPTRENTSTLPASATPDFSRISCTMSTDQEGIELYPAPFFSSYRILPTMEPGFAYQAADTFPTMVRLMRDGQTAGWVDYRMLAVSLDGPSCLEVQYAGELTDFMDDLCFVVADPPVETYFDAEYTEPTGMFIGSEPHYVVTTLGTEGPRGSCAGHAGPCFRFNPATVDLVGNCADLPRSAETTTITQLWPQPDGSSGSPIREISEGQFIAVQFGEESTGPPPPDAPTPGKWLHVKLSGMTLPRHGWVWSGYVKYR